MIAVQYIQFTHISTLRTDYYYYYRDVTPYPEYLNSLVSSNKLDLTTANREHTRAYLQSYNAGDPKPPVQYYKKVAAKDKVEEILEGKDLDVFKTLIQ